jgi:hypothetical protein
MNKYNLITGLLRQVFDSPKVLQKASQIVCALLEAGSPRLSRIAEKMPGQSASNYKTIQRFLEQVDLKMVLKRFFQEQAEFVIADPTEMPRPHARHTEYVGRLSDGRTLGYWLLVLATPFRGRALPFHFITYSSQTISHQATSRNQEHFRAFADLQPLLGARPLVLDREFSYLELLKALRGEKIHFVVRLRLGPRQVNLLSEDGKPLQLSMPRVGTMHIYRKVLYMGNVLVNLAGVRRAGFSQPIWILTDLDPQRGVEIYLQRMKIEESFRDCKSLLGLTQLMNKQQLHLEQMLALSLLAYVLGSFVGESLRDISYAGLAPQQLSYQDLFLPTQRLPLGGKWSLYSGLFVLLKQNVRISPHALRRLQKPLQQAFAVLLFGDVRSFV